MKHALHCTFLALAAAFCSVQGNLQAQTCSDLIELPIQGGFTRTLVRGLSDSGSIVAGVSSGVTSVPATAFRWSADAGYESLGLTSGFASYAEGISGNGEYVVGSAQASLPLGRWHPVRWDAAGVPLDLLPASLGSAAGVARGISQSGNTVVGDYNDGVERGFRWTESGGFEDLGSLGGGSTHVCAVSDDGSKVVGYSEDLSGLDRAFLWTPLDGMRDLGTLGGARSLAFGISGDGSVIVGAAESTSGVSRASKWTEAAGMVRLDADLRLGSEARVVNVDGSVIGGYDPFGPGVGLAFLWTAETGVQKPFPVESRVTTALTRDGSLASLEYLYVGGTGTFVQEGQFLQRLRPFGTVLCLDAVPNSTGCTGRISLFGSLDASANQLTLAASRLPANAFGYFLTSMTPTAATTVPGAQGVLCLGGAIGRFVGPGQIQDSGQGGHFELELDLQSIPTPTGFVSAAASQTWHFQAWHRDQNPTSTSNFTDSISVTLR